MATNITKLRALHKSTHTKTETIEVTSSIVAKWHNPPFQRPLRVNSKVENLAAQLAAEGTRASECIIPGVITLGVFDGKTYLLDGQHRIHAFLMSEVATGYADVRVHHFDSIGEMGTEFVELNSRLVNLRPDDILKGLAGGSPGLQMIERKCPFVAYAYIRHGGVNAPTVSMSLLLRSWRGSQPEVPHAAGASALDLGTALTVNEAEQIVTAVSLLEKAWGRDRSNARLWSTLNLALCLWLYRRIVVAPHSSKTVLIDRDLFTKCMMSLAASSDYNEWLVGRQLCDRDKAPAYNRIKSIVAKRIQVETGRKYNLPQPAWAHG